MACVVYVLLHSRLERGMRVIVGLGGYLGRISILSHVLNSLWLFFPWLEGAAPDRRHFHPLLPVCFFGWLGGNSERLCSRTHPTTIRSLCEGSQKVASLGKVYGRTLGRQLTITATPRI